MATAAEIADLEKQMKLFMLANYRKMSGGFSHEDQKEYNNMVSKLKAMKSGASTSAPMTDAATTGEDIPDNTLWGVTVDPSGLDMNDAQKYVLSGISEATTPLLKKARSSLVNRGFGRYDAPTLETEVYKPIISSMANQTGSALTNLYFQNEANKRAWEANKRANTAADEQYDLAEAQLKALSKKDQQASGTVICTELYRQGLISFTDIKYDIKFLRKYVDKDMHDKYLAWAVPCVNLMQKSKIVTFIFYFLVFFWGAYMRRTVKVQPLGIKGSIGKVINFIGIAYGDVYALQHRRELNVHS